MQIFEWNLKIENEVRFTRSTARKLKACISRYSKQSYAMCNKLYTGGGKVSRSEKGPHQWLLQKLQCLPCGNCTRTLLAGETLVLGIMALVGETCTTRIRPDLKENVLIPRSWRDGIKSSSACLLPTSLTSTHLQLLLSILELFLQLRFFLHGAL